MSLLADYEDPTLWPRIRKAIVAERDGRMRAVAQGHCQDHAAYKDQCGYIRALSWVLDVVAEMGKPPQPANDQQETA